MKLDNRGWGLGVFLAFVFVFLICLIVASVNAYKLGLTKESSHPYFNSEPIVTMDPVVSPSPIPTPTPTPTAPVAEGVNNSVVVPTPTPTPSSTPSVLSSSSTINMVELRHKVIQAAGMYRNTYHRNIKEGKEVIVSFQKLIDQNYLEISPCSGYVKLKQSNRNIQYIPYFSCPGYVSDGYLEKYDEK